MVGRDNVYAAINKRFDKRVTIGGRLHGRIAFDERSLIGIAGIIKPEVVYAHFSRNSLLRAMHIGKQRHLDRRREMQDVQQRVMACREIHSHL